MKEKTAIRIELERLIPRIAMMNIPVYLISLIWGFSFPFLLGLLVGTAYACISLIYLGITIERSVEKTVKKAQINMFVSYGVRYAMLFLLCFVGIQTKSMSFIALIIPQFYAKAVLWLEMLFPKIFKK